MEMCSHGPEDASVNVYLSLCSLCGKCLVSMSAAPLRLTCCLSLSLQLFLKLHQDFKRLYFLGKKGRSLENICPVGDPLRISDTVRPFLCGNDPGKPTCPPLYQCLVQKGNDYGVCCPASLKIQKSGQCPVKVENKELECGSMCSHDLECPSVQKCCQTDQCGSSCMHPKNVTGKCLIVLMPLN